MKYEFPHSFFFPEKGKPCFEELKIELLRIEDVGVNI